MYVSCFSFFQLFSLFDGCHEVIRPYSFVVFVLCRLARGHDAGVLASQNNIGSVDRLSDDFVCVANDIKQKTN